MSTTFAIATLCLAVPAGVRCLYGLWFVWWHELPLCCARHARPW